MKADNDIVVTVGGEEYTQENGLLLIDAERNDGAIIVYLQRSPMMTVGHRVYANEKGELHLAEGDYGLHPLSGWQCRPFGHHAGGIGGHDVVEHEDGTITVSPSIILTDFDEDGNEIQWHGYLERGVWREV